MNTSFIFVKNLTKTFRTIVSDKGGIISRLFKREYKMTAALDHVSFEIPENTLVGLIGPNGAGKTTIMKILSGVLYPTSGDVNVFGFTPFDKKREYLKQIAFIMGQKNQLLWELPAVDSFKLTQAVYELSDQTYSKTLKHLLDLLDGYTIAQKPVKTLSLGQRMKMELVNALLHQPKVLYLDEPTIGLDVVAQKTMRDFIKVYQKENHATILLTSHYMEDVRQLAERILLIYKGKIVFDGKLSVLANNYSEEKTITLIVDELPSRKILEKVGEPDTIEMPKIIYKVNRKELGKKVSSIVRYIDFHDISIEDEPIEEVIGKIYRKYLVSN